MLPEIGFLLKRLQINTLALLLWRLITWIQIRYVQVLMIAKPSFHRKLTANLELQIALSPPYNIHDRCSLWCELVKLNSDAIVRFCIFKRFLDMQVSLQNRVRRGKHEAGLVSTASSPLAVHNRKRDTVRAGGGHNVSLSQQSHLPHP